MINTLFMKSIIKLTFLLVCSISFAQTNLLDSSTWTIGTGSAPGFNRSGVDAENTREMGIGPHGTSVLLWKTIPEATGNSGAGGWTTDRLSIDHTKTYRFTVWIKKTNSLDGETYFGPRAYDASDNYATNYLGGGYIGLPYFWSGDLPVLDQWYLLVGYVHHSAYSITTDIGGVYNGSTGAKVLDSQDYKFESDAIEIVETIFLSANTNTNDSQYYYDPTMYEVNGQEPTIQELIDGPDTQAPTTPTLSSTAQTDATVDLSWTAATDNVAVTNYKVYKEGVLESILGNVLSYQVTGLTTETTYNFTVTALDAAGNESVVSNAIAITTNSPQNNQELYTLSNAASTLNEVNGTTGWTENGETTVTTATETDGSSNYSIVIRRGSQYGYNAATNRVQNLTNGVEYTITIRARNDSGNIGSGLFTNWSGVTANLAAIAVSSTSYEDYAMTFTSDGSDFSFSAYGCDCTNNDDKLYISSISIREADLQSPTVGVLSSTSQTDTTIDLSWTAATDNVAVTNYKVYKDAVLETTLGNVLSYQVTGLTAATAYNFTVTALDAAGNESVVSNTFSITTNAGFRRQSNSSVIANSF